MKLKKGDNVIVISGKDKGKKGKIVRVFPKENKIILEGLNMTKRHQRPRKSGEKGSIKNIEMPINASNVMIVCPSCEKPTRIKHDIVKDKKVRVCKKCGEQLDV